jgi:hypothetical protein
MTKAATPSERPAMAIKEVKDANAPFFERKYL